MSSTEPRRLGEVAGLFLKLGFTAFGGPAAHTGMMHDEVVRRRAWITDQEFLDLVGATNLIPGPNSTEMAIHLGFLRAGWPGLLVAGLCFVTPAMLIVIGSAWMYTQFGSLPQAQWLLFGVKPVVIAIIVQAIWTLGRQAAKGLPLLSLGFIVLGLYSFLHLNEIALLFAGGVAAVLVGNWRRLWQARGGPSLLAIWLPSSVSVLPAVAAAYSLPVLFLTFLKIGAILYGSGYVLLAFLRADFVVRLGWLTDKQLIDAIAVGQITPGPLFTSATFIGYLLGGFPAAILATAAIFLPSFVFVAISNPLIPKIRQSRWVGSFLDGINVASLSLMTGVTLQLMQASIVDVGSMLIAVVALVALLRFKVNSTWLVAGGAVAGLVFSAFR
jgi:chromate transporter